MTIQRFKFGYLIIQFNKYFSIIFDVLFLRSGDTAICILQMSSFHFIKINSKFNSTVSLVPNAVLKCECDCSPKCLPND